MIFLMMLIAWAPWLLALCAAFWLGLRAVRALEGRSKGGAELTALRERIQLLEESLESQGDELRRVAEGQRFTERLLAARVTDGSGGSNPPTT